MQKTLEIIWNISVKRSHSVQARRPDVLVKIGPENKETIEAFKSDNSNTPKTIGQT